MQVLEIPKKIVEQKSPKIEICNLLFSRFRQNLLFIIMLMIMTLFARNQNVQFYLFNEDFTTYGGRVTLREGVDKVSQRPQDYVLKDH